ncbi:MAG: hypothetical protein ACP5P1_12695 [Acidimicrobiales bacterium]
MAKSAILALNLWDPHIGLALWAVLATSFVLGMIHGVTPDEHTWPITFSYAVGGYSSRAGMRNALVFSLAFTFQRALASELAFLALGNFLTLGSRGDYIVYVVVGFAMFWAARYIHGGKLPWHFDLHLHEGKPRVKSGGGTAIADAGHDHEHTHVHAHVHGGVALNPAAPHWTADSCPECHEPNLVDPRAWMPALHGFIAGWGFGAFALIVYTVLAPSMPSAWWGWVPGALFGLGTTAVQVMVGGLVGWIVRRKGASPQVSRRLGLVVAGRTLAAGGVAFVLGGLFGIAFPNLASFSVSTGVHVHNLAHLGLPLVLVVVSVAGVGVGSLVSEIRHIPSQAVASSAVAQGGSSARRQESDAPGV